MRNIPGLATDRNIFEESLIALISCLARQTTAAKDTNQRNGKMDSAMRPSKIGSLIARVLIAYGVMGGLSSTCSLAKSAQNAVLQTNETLNETAQPDTIASIQAADSVKPQNLDSSIDIEIDQRFNELRSELLDDRASTINWWLAVIGLVLTFFAIAIPILGFLGYRKFREIENEAQKSAQKAKYLVEEIREIRNKSNEYYQDMTAEKAVDDPSAEEKARTTSKNPVASRIDKAIARAIFLQKEGKIGAAIKIWQGIADSNEEIDNNLAGRAWFSVGYLENERGGTTNFEKAIFAYDQAIRLNPSLSESFNNRGIAKHGLGRYKDAIVDYDQSIELNPNDSSTYYNRGIAKGKLDRIPEARSDFDKAHEIAKQAGDEKTVSMMEEILRNFPDSENT